MSPSNAKRFMPLCASFLGFTGLRVSVNAALNRYIAHWR